MKLRTKFEDEDFKLGEVVEANVYYGGGKGIKLMAEPTKGGGIHTFYYSTLKEFTDNWEDAPEEPKEYWAIDCFSPDGELVSQFGGCSERIIENRKQIGNHFETREETEKAVEKLKAITRLKDKGFRFCGHDDRDRGQLGDIVIYAEMPTFEYDDDSTRDDLDLLFGGEE